MNNQTIFDFRYYAFLFELIKESDDIIGMNVVIVGDIF